MAVMTMCAAMMGMCLFIGSINERNIKKFEKQSAEFKARMEEIDRRRESSGQNEMLIKAKAWKAEQEAAEREKVSTYTKDPVDPIFDSMSADWGIEDVEDFVFYEIPEEYAENGGYFPEKMQIYTKCLCEQYGVSYSLIIAMIERESGYRYDKSGDDGCSFGYMQIYEKWHEDRMERLNCTDLLNPYNNVKVGIDYIAELIEKYGNKQDALTAYNYGEKGAQEKMWSKGVYTYSYNQEILQREQEIKEELTKGEKSK